MNRTEIFRVAGVLFAAGLLAGCNRAETEPAGDRPSDASREPLPEQPILSAEAPQIEPITAQPATDPAEVLVTVNGESITRAEAETELMRMMSQSGQQIPPEYLSQFAEQFMPQVLESMIGRKLMEAAVAEGEFEATEADVETIIEEIVSTLPEGMTLEAALMQQGMTEQELRSDVTAGVRMRQMTDRWTAASEPPTDDEVDAFYREHPEHFMQPESVAARHILLRVPEDADEAVRAEKMAKADALREQLLEGADFAALATEHSDCPSSAEGGLLGEFGRGDMVPEFDAVAFTLEPGVISDIVTTDFGYHIIRVESRAAASVTDLADAAEDIRNHLQQQRNRKLIEARVDAMREAADISYKTTTE